MGLCQSRDMCRELALEWIWAGRYFIQGRLREASLCVGDRTRIPFIFSLGMCVPSLRMK